MGLLFEEIDPLKRTIRCTEECWKRHIVDRRSFMSGKIELVKKAIKNPDVIYGDADFANRENYYHVYSVGFLGLRKRYMKVVIEIKGKSGRVVTAFPCDTIKKSESLKWAA